MDPSIDPSIVALAALSIAALGALLALRARRWIAAARSARRMARARRGEHDARALLIAEGFSIEREQAPAAMVLRADGAALSFAVRADYLVRRRGKRYVAEVKTGARAPDLAHAPTRRQLIEYALAFDVDGVLLVDPEARRVRWITFRPPRRPGSLGIAFAVGALAGAALARACGCSM